MKRMFGSGALHFISPVTVLLLWEAAARAGLLDVRFFPLPSAVLAEILRMTGEGVLLADVTASLLRVFGGLVLGGFPAVVLGILMARVRLVYYLFYPLVLLTFPLPKIALIPFVILVLGMGELSKIVVVSLGAFYLILLNTYFGVKGISRVHFEVAALARYRKVDIWRHVILPGALPSIFNGVKLAVGICLILIVAAEFVGSSSGLGYRIWTSWEMFRITSMFAALFVLAALGWILNMMLGWLEGTLMPWKGAED